MNPFVPGDIVRRVAVGAPYKRMKIGDEDRVVNVRTNSIDLEKFEEGHTWSNFVLVRSKVEDLDAGTDW